MLKRIWKNKSGASLIEVLIAIVILGMVVVPLGSSFVLSVRLNTRSRALMQEQIAVSNAVEVLMARGIAYDSDFQAVDPTDLENVSVNLELPVTDEDGKPLYYPVTVTSVSSGEGTRYSLETTVRAVALPQEPDPEPGEGGDG